MRNKTPQQPPEERIKNFLEVALGFSESEAQEEASRCLQCKNKPCVKGCPVGIDIPAFIKLIKEGRQKEALEKIKEKNNLPAVCGRVCPQENQCEAVCILNKKKIPVNIGALERYAADYALTHKLQPTANSRQNLAAKIAVVGSGPAGLTCAADLAKRGFKVTLFESLHTAGGVLVYGIPEFRLPKKIVQDEVDYIRNLGVELKVDTLIGNTFTLEDLFKNGFKAAFIAVGAGLPQFLGIEGENLPGVYSANEFLTRVNLMKAYKFPEYATPINIGKRVAVIGGGNVALDSSRVSLRLGSTAALVYRRSENEMPGRLEEIKNAKEEGVALNILTQPIRIIADKTGVAGGLECIKMQLGEPDTSGRKRPVPIENSNFILEADTVIIAIGQNPNPLLPRITPGLKTNKDRTIVVDENLMTSIPGVFAGGDITSGADTVISAMGAGKKAALAIEKYIKEQHGQNNG
ncbi:MAG: NADPH-dependent glutamate synthase [Candidatus Omnitrophota bacterium]|jgi:glutamate synthase (NADPH/NADH) small chain|nr:NADPH-dependent glutamate synthase [Candidatus Omnitrophota bacterium]